MTPTREQIEAEVFDCAEKLSAVVDGIDGDYCAHHTAPAAQVVVERLRKLAAALATPSMPEPSPARAGYPYTVAGDEVMAQRFPQEAAPMPPIEIGDVVRLDGFGLVTVNRAEEADVLSRGSDGLVAIYKPVWRREPRP